MRRRARLWALAGCVALAGCTIKHVETEAVADVEAANQLRPGDRVDLVVDGQPDLSGTYELDRDGRFEMPLIGVVDAYGQTPAEVEQQVVAALADGYLRTPVVTVTPAAPRPIFLFGAVENPGSYFFRDDLTVAAAIAMAGGAIGELGGLEIVLTPAGRASAARVVGPEAPLAPGDVLELRERSS